MKRPMLVSGITLMLSTLAFLTFGKAVVFSALIGAASVFFIWLIKPLKLRKYILIPAACVCVFISALSFLAFDTFIYKKAVAFESTGTDIAAKVIDSGITSSEKPYLILKTEKIGDTKKSLKIIYYCSDSDELPELYSFVSIKNAELFIPEDDSGDALTSYIDDGIYLAAFSKAQPDVLWQCRKTPYYYCIKLRDAFVKSANTFLCENEAGVLIGMLFGDKSGITSETKSDFRLSGVSHLLAVSGLHTSLWCGLLLALLSLFHVPVKIRNLVCIGFLVVFAVISAFTPSVLRACLMTLLLLLSPFFKRQTDSLNSLGFAVSALIIINPYTAQAVGFLLSVSATLGVIIAATKNEAVLNLTRKLKNRHIKRISEYILTSFAVSTFAGLFTLPVTAYFFGTFCLISPLTNLFAVRLAFWALVSGFVSAVVSFVPFSVFTDISYYLYKITSVLLKLLIKLVNTAASPRLAVLPVERLYLAVGFAAAIILLFAGYRLYKRKNRKFIRRAAYASAAAVISVSFIIPMLPLNTNEKIYVPSLGNDTAVVAQCGTHFALVGGAKTKKLFYSIDEFMPRCGLQALDLYAVTSFGSATVDNVGAVASEFKPEKTVVNSFVYNCFYERELYLPENTVVKDRGLFSVGGKINIEIVDTYGMYCVIIYGSNKTAVISTYAGNDLAKLFKTYGVPDILVLPSGAKVDDVGFVDTLILSTGSETLLDVSAGDASLHCNKLYRTALDGAVTLNI